MVAPTLLALDFDGVLCDGLLEYFETSWKAYCQVFEPAETTPPPDLAEQFYPLRPVIETGWEMPMVLHALLKGIAAEDILQNWRQIVPTLLTEAGLTSGQVMTAVDGIRDRWIQADLNGWLELHRTYPGTLDWLQNLLASDLHTVIISTKEGRFIHAILQQQGLEMPREQILGKEVQQPKTETLRQLLAQYPGSSAEPTRLWFVEDRYKTLQKVEAEADLNDVSLFLVDWGYNTAAEREEARRDSRVNLLSLSTIVQEFSAWVEPT
ncbi:MAG: HAD family hydrolase [Leptolyngbyaceae cyanobacterium]